MVAAAAARRRRSATSACWSRSRVFGVIADVADAIAAVGLLRDDARLRRQRRHLLRLRALPLSARAAADAVRARPASVALPASWSALGAARWLAVSAGGIWTVAAVVAMPRVFANWPILSPTLMRAVTETNLGAALQAEGRLDEAIDHYRRAIALAPDYAPAYNNLATALRAKGRLD